MIMPPLMGDRRIRIYPDTPERIMALAEQVGLKTKKVVEIENLLGKIKVAEFDPDKKTLRLIQP